MGAGKPRIATQPGYTQRYGPARYPNARKLCGPFPAAYGRFSGMAEHRAKKKPGTMAGLQKSVRAYLLRQAPESFGTMR